jgi:hypothetical protein
MRGHKWELKKQAGSPNWYAVFYIPGRGDKPVWRSTGTADEGEAEIRAGEKWVKELRAAGKPIPEDAAPFARVTIEDAAAEFVTLLERQAHEHREQYVKRYESDLNLYVIRKTDQELADARAAGKEPWQPPWTFVDELTTSAWEEEKLRLHKANGGPLGARSIAHLTNTLRHLLRFCASPARRYIEIVPELKSPANRLIKLERRKRRAFTAAEREKFIRLIYKYAPKVSRKGRQATHAPGTAGRFYETLHFSLLRRGEGWAITRGWLDRRRKIITVPPEHSKSGEEEQIPLHPRAERALVEQIKARGKLELDEPIFGQVNVVPAFEWAMKVGNFRREGVTAHHTTRHTGGTILAKQTKSRDVLKKAGRWHADASVEPYLHVDVEDARPLMEKL